MLTVGGCGAGAASTTNEAEALMDDVLAVMVTVPLDSAGMVMLVLNAPVAVVLKGKVVEPTITVPVVEALNPVPDAATAEPAGPEAGFKATCAAGAAFAGWIKATAIPAATKKAITNAPNDLNKATILQICVRPQPLIICTECTGSSIRPKSRSLIKKPTIIGRNHFRVCGTALT